MSGSVKRPAAAQALLPAHLYERTDPGDVADLEQPWLEPYDGDEAAARDALWHTDYGVAGDW